MSFLSVPYCKLVLAIANGHHKACNQESLFSFSLQQLKANIGAFLLSTVAVLVLAGCKADVPDGVLSQSEMEDVLYDYHLAQSLAEKDDASAVTKTKSWKYNEHYFIKAALAKYGLTEEDFNRSLEWYTRHTDQLFDIYKALSERAEAEGGSGVFSNIAEASNGQQGDTTDVWHGARAYLLSSQTTSHFSFELAADTALHFGDRLVFRLNALWIYREGSKEAFVQLALVYEGDSIAVRSQNIYSSGTQEVTQRIGDRRLVAIRGFVYQKTEWTDKPKLLVLNNLSLLHIRDKEDETPMPAKETPVALDSLQQPAHTAEQRLRDSLRISDSIRLAQPHFK